jgi:alpha-ketoglutarate-dependent taurine dioxygenase
MDLETANLKPLIGSVVRGDPDALAAGTYAAELRTLLVARGVLVFRDLDITLEQQRAITANFGRLRIAGSGDGLQKVTLDPEESPEYSKYFSTTFFWHTDGHFNQTVPGFAASLRPARLPPNGGDTEFLNTYAAYDGLSEEDRRLVDGLRVVHTQLAANAAAMPSSDAPAAAAWLERPGAVQPLVWRHLDGRKSLLLGTSVSHVEGMHPADSYDLLLRLRHHMSQPQYVYSHAWRMNDLLVWDNTGTMHRVRPFDPDSGRLLTRFTVEGEEPIRAP